MKLLAIKIIAAAFASSIAVANLHATALVCKSHIIDSGTHISVALTNCGTPVYNNYSTVIYTSSNDGMAYTLHVNSSGIIDNVESSV